MAAAACGALRNVAGLADNKPKVASAGALEVVVAAMKAHVGVPAVQEAGCGALHNLAGVRGEDRAAVAAVGGLEAVAAALKAHPGVTGVQEAGKRALGVLRPA